MRLYRVAAPAPALAVHVRLYVAECVRLRVCVCVLYRCTAVWYLRMRVC